MHCYALILIWGYIGVQYWTILVELSHGWVIYCKQSSKYRHISLSALHSHWRCDYMIMGAEEEHYQHGNKLFNCYLCDSLSLPQTITSKQENDRMVTLIFKMLGSELGFKHQLFHKSYWSISDYFISIVLITRSVRFYFWFTEESIVREFVLFMLCSYFALWFILTHSKSYEGIEDGEQNTNRRYSLEYVFAHAVTAINTNLTGIINDKEAEL